MRVAHISCRRKDGGIFGRSFSHLCYHFIKFKLKEANLLSFLPYILFAPKFIKNLTRLNSFHLCRRIGSANYARAICQRLEKDYRAKHAMPTPLQPNQPPKQEMCFFCKQPSIRHELRLPINTNSRTKKRRNEKWKNNSLPPSSRTIVVDAASGAI